MSKRDQAAYDHGFRNGISTGVVVMVGRLSEIANEIKAAGNPKGGAELMRIGSHILNEYLRSAPTSEGKLP